MLIPLPRAQALALAGLVLAAGCASKTVTDGSSTSTGTSTGAAGGSSSSTSSSGGSGATSSSTSSSSSSSGSSSGGSNSGSDSTTGGAAGSNSAGSSSSSSSSSSGGSGTSTPSGGSGTSTPSGGSSSSSSSTGGASVPTLNFDTTVASVAEGVTTVRAQVNIDLAPSTDLTVNYLVTGTAVPTRDFAVPSSVTLAAGENSAQIPIAVADNGLITDDSTVVLTLLALGSVTAGDANRYTLTIQNTDIAPIANDGTLNAYVATDTAGVLTSNVIPGNTVHATYAIKDPPAAGGTVNITDPSTGAYIYTAGSSQLTDTFTFTVSTDTATSDIGTVNVNVTIPVPVITGPASAAYLLSSPVFTGDTLTLEASVDNNSPGPIACEVSTALDSRDPAALTGPIACGLLPSLVPASGVGSNAGSSASARGTASYVAANGNALLTWTPTRQQRGTFFFHLSAQGLGDPGAADFVVTVDSPRSQPTARFDAAFAKLDPTGRAPLSPLLATDAIALMPNLYDANSLATLEGYSGAPWAGTWPYNLVTNAPGAPPQSVAFSGTHALAGNAANANSYNVSAWVAPLDASSPGAVILSNLQQQRGFTLRQSAHTPGALELALGTPPSVDYRAAVLADQPVGYWPLDEASGPFKSLVNASAGLAFDASGAAPNTVSPGTVGLLMNDPDTGVLFNQAAALQASDPCQLLVPGQAIVSQGQVSLEAWVQFENLSADQTLISTESTSMNNGYALVVETLQGSTYFAFNFGGLLGQMGVASNTVPQAGSIYHVVGTYDGQTARIYVNGALDGSAQLSPGNAPSGFYVGAQANGTAPLTGTLDEVAAYTYPLSAAQVLRHFRVGAEHPSLSGPYANVIDADLPTAHWPLNELAGQVAHNSVAGPDATYVGAFDLAHSMHDGANAAGFTRPDTGAIQVEASAVTAFYNGSMELWVKPVWQDGGSVETLVGIGDGVNNNLTVQLSPGGAASDGFVAVILRSNSNIAMFPASLQDQAWHHLVYTQIGGTAAVYADGQLLSAHPFAIVSSTGVPLSIGAVPGGTQKFVGDMQDVAIYDRALSLVDVQHHYAQHRALACVAATRWEDGQWHQVGVSYNAPASGAATAALWVDGAQECAFTPPADGAALADLSLAATQGLSPPWYGAAAQVSFSAGTGAGAPSPAAAFADFAAAAESFRAVAEGDVVEPYAHSAASAPLITLDAANPMGVGGYLLPGQAGCGASASVWKNLASTAGSASLAGYAMSACASGGVWGGDGSAAAPYALQFDGSSGYVTLPADATDWTQGLTVEVWANPNALAGPMAFFDLGAGQNNNNIVLSTDSSSAPGRLALAVVADGNAHSLFVDGAVEAHVWHQYVGTVAVDSAQSISWHLYRDGVELAANGQVGASVVPPPTRRPNGYVGRSSGQGDALFQGQVGMLRLYRRGLSAAEVRQNCQMQAARYGVTCP